MEAVIEQNKDLQREVRGRPTSGWWSDRTRLPVVGLTRLSSLHMHVLVGSWRTGVTR